MAHKALIGGTAYSITGGRTLIGGTGYGISKGRTLVSGTGYDISFATSSQLSDFAAGSIVKLNESGSPVEFYVAKHDYESGLNGTGRTLLVRKDCYDSRTWNNSYNSNYSTSAIDSWLNSTYKNLLDAGVQSAMATTTIYYTPGNGNTTATTLARAIFLLSATELGRYNSNYVTKEGTALSIASTIRIAYMNGSAVSQWTRSPYMFGISDQYSGLYFPYAIAIGSGGAIGTVYMTNSRGSRPCFTLPGTTLVDADNNVIV
jgi:hypothetical protein